MVDLTSLIATLLFILLVDGLKLFWEVCAKYKDRQFESEPGLVTAVICCYNEENELAKTVSSLKKALSEIHIIVVNDGSTDSTAEIAKNCEVCLVDLKKNVGKVAAMKEGLKHVRTPYTLILDADVRFEDGFKLPTSLLETQTAVAFNVIPVPASSTDCLWKKLLIGLQAHEYEKSMQLGRRAQDKVESVHCVSGAAGLFQTERLKKLSEYHTEIFTSEDLERTLIELVACGRVVFVNECVQTEVPKSLREMVHQRVISWWPGLYRNVPLFFSILFKRDISLRFRGEMLYQILSLILDPFKLVSLVLAVITGKWMILVVVYLTYFFLEMFVRFRLSGSVRGYCLLMAVYPLYGCFQMVLRLCAFPVFFWQRYIKKRWKAVLRAGKIAISLVFALLLFAPKGSFAEGESNLGEILKHKHISDFVGEKIKNGDILFMSKYEHISDSTGREIENGNFFLSFGKKIYAEINTGNDMERLNLGGYVSVKDINLNLDMRLGRYDLMPKITAEKSVSKAFVGRIMGGYSVNNIQDFPIVGVGTDYYYGDYNRLSVDVVKEFGRREGATLILKNHLEKLHWRTDIGGSITNFGDPGVFILVGYKKVFLEVIYYKNFDFNKFNRIVTSFGFKFN